MRSSLRVPYELPTLLSRAKTREFRERLASGGESVEDILEEAFAVVREAAWRVLELRHYDVQVGFYLLPRRFSVTEMLVLSPRTNAE